MGRSAIYRLGDTKQSELCPGGMNSGGMTMTNDDFDTPLPTAVCRRPQCYIARSCCVEHGSFGRVLALRRAACVARTKPI